MIEMTTNPSVQDAIRRAHEERSKVIHQLWAWLTGSR